MAKVNIIYFDVHTGYYPSVHHGIAYIIGTLKSDGHAVSLHHVTEEAQISAIRNIVETQTLDVLGLSFSTNQKKYAQCFLDNSNISARLTIAGGVHCTLGGESTLKELPTIDGICVGEGELALQELCRRIDENRNYVSTKSFIFRNAGKIVRNPVAPLCSIDELALPDYTLFDCKRIISDSGDCFPMMLGRGCPYACHYCCNHAFRQVYPNKNMYVRFPSVSRCLSIIRNNLELYPGASKISFADDTFTLNREWLFEFCGLYAKEIGLPFTCNARVETIDDQVVSHLKRGGCISIDFGVESGNQWLRRHVLNRKHSNEEIKAAFAITGKYGLNRSSFNIVGLPFETPSMARDTLDLNRDLRPEFGKCFYFYPYPGTKLRQLCEDYNLLRDDIESVSGYLEAPSLKEIFMSHKEMKRHFEMMQCLFYARLLFSKISIPLSMEKALIRIVFCLRKPILSLLEPTTNNRFIVRLRRILRRGAMKHLR